MPYVPPLILYEYGKVPPDPETEMLPVEFPLQSTSVCFETEIEIVVGSVILLLPVIEQPLESVIL